MKKIALEIVALSSSVTQNHSYAVVLGEVNGIRRLPIIIGAFEAQAIVVALERIKPSRPLTHDLFFNFTNVFSIEIKEVLIYRLEEGIFYAKLICSQDNINTLEIDSRTSDALALAVRAGCPIFTYENIMEAASLQMDQEMTVKIATSAPEPAPQEEDADLEAESIDHQKLRRDLKYMTTEELNDLLEEVLEKEDYMTAVAIRDELKSRETDTEQ